MSNNGAACMSKHCRLEGRVKLTSPLAANKADWMEKVQATAEGKDESPCDQGLRSAGTFNLCILSQ